MQTFNIKVEDSLVSKFLEVISQFKPEELIVNQEKTKEEREREYINQEIEKYEKNENPNLMTLEEFKTRFRARR